MKFYFLATKQRFFWAALSHPVKFFLLLNLKFFKSNLELGELVAADYGWDLATAVYLIIHMHHLLVIIVIITLLLNHRHYHPLLP